MFKVDIPEYQKQRPIIQLIPLVDILMYMLIFFMAVSVMQQFEMELSINVPKAREARDSTRLPGEIIINIDRSGKVVVNQKPLSRGGLAGILTRIAQVYPNQPVIIRADADTRHASVIRVLDACAAAGIWNISFATVKEETKSPLAPA